MTDDKGTAAALSVAPQATCSQCGSELFATGFMRRAGPRPFASTSTLVLRCSNVECPNTMMLHYDRVAIIRRD